MKRIMLIVAYDGTDYHGWQLQPGVPTIEGELNKALTALLGEEIQVIGASRTDSGVHALCNAAVFDTDTKIPAQKIAYALNRRISGSKSPKRQSRISIQGTAPAGRLMSIGY